MGASAQRTDGRSLRVRYLLSAMKKPVFQSDKNGLGQATRMDGFSMS
jgi:hypothetical protein